MDPVNAKLLIAGGGLAFIRIIATMLKEVIPEKARRTVCDYADSGIAATFVAFIIATFLFQISRVEGISMKPTLHTGEYTLIDKVSYRFRPIQRGDIIVFRSPVDPGRDYIKRVIGLPGETVEIRLGKVYINRRPLKEHYLVEAPYYEFGPERVPKSSLFVLGDNRNRSLDSHRFHSISEESIRGRAWIVLWPPSELGHLSSR